jgi:hypothetical protein
MKGFVGGLFGGVVLWIVLLVLFLFYYKHNLVIHPVHIANIEAVDRSTSIEAVNAKIKAINKLKEQGVLLTPHEYTNNVVNYYNMIITCLVTLLAIFSLVTFFHLKFLTEDEVKKQVTDLLRKSPEVRNLILEDMKGRIDETLLDVTARMETLEDEVKSLKVSHRWDGLEFDNEDKEGVGDVGKIRVKK